MKDKQKEISDIIKKRIESGVYKDKLPDTSTLAEEFSVNIKTMARAINRLVKIGFLERKRHSGTKILPAPAPTPPAPLVEILFEGFTSAFSHPFWGGIWDGMVSRLSHAGYRPVLNRQKMNPQTQQLDLQSFSLIPSAAGRILLGIFDENVFNAVQETGTPYISACDHLNMPNVPQVTFDFTYGIQSAIDFLAFRGYKKIGFIGQIQNDHIVRIPHKYLAYCEAMKNNVLENFIEAEQANLFLNSGAAALKKILNRTLPEALIVAHDHHLPEIQNLLHELKITIPLIGCDGLSLPDLVQRRSMVRAPLYECGEVIARQIISAIIKNCQPTSVAIPTTFVNAGIKQDLASNQIY